MATDHRQGGSSVTRVLPERSPALNAYLDGVRAKHRGRLIFALDATGSRQPTWDVAARIHGEMFAAAGGLVEVQLVHYRGVGKFKASEWVSSSAELQRLMASVTCDWGDTQITRVLEHALGEARSQKIGAVVFVGDSVEEGTWSLYYLAEELGKAGVPLFLFQEDDDASVEKTFRKMAELSGGAYARFDRSSADRLKSLLGAVAAYATGGRRALESYTNKQGGEVRLLTAQLRR